MKRCLLSLICFVATILFSFLTPQFSYAIINPDRELKVGEASYVASIQTWTGESYESFCSGSLISPLIIITAAHCIVDYDQDDASTWVAYFSENTLSSPNGLRVDIVSALYHQKYEDSLSTIQINPDGTETVLKEGYVAPGTSEFDADIAILLLRSPITEIKPVTMARANTQIAANWRVYGWGATQSDMLIKNTMLRTASVNDATVEMSEQLEDPMENIYAAYGLDSLGQIRTTCYGDSGGPLVDGKGLLIGLTSFAMVENCEEIAPTVYTKVASYRTWILRNSITIQSRYARMNTLPIGTPVFDAPTHKHPIKVYGRW